MLIRECGPASPRRDVVGYHETILIAGIEFAWVANWASYIFYRETFLIISSVST